MLSLAVLLILWHGVNVMRRMHHVGEVQAVFSPAMADAVARADGRTVRLQPLNQREDWIYLRLSHDIPSYRGIAIGDRVQLVEPGAPADYLIQADGSLQPLH